MARCRIRPGQRPPYRAYSSYPTGRSYNPRWTRCTRDGEIHRSNQTSDDLPSCTRDSRYFWVLSGCQMWIRIHHRERGNYAAALHRNVRLETRLRPRRPIHIIRLHTANCRREDALELVHRHPIHGVIPVIGIRRRDVRDLVHGTGERHRGTDLGKTVVHATARLVRRNVSTHLCAKAGADVAHGVVLVDRPGA
jgi:hypothetical protein